MDEENEPSFRFVFYDRFGERVEDQQFLATVTTDYGCLEDDTLYER